MSKTTPQPAAAGATAAIGSSADSGTTDGRTSWTRVLVAAVSAAAAILAVLLAFAWPTKTATPKDMPLLVAGPADQTAVLKQKLADSPFVVQDTTDRTSAVTALQQREAYGALVVGPQGVEVLTASAASPVAAQALTGAAQQFGTEQAKQLAAVKQDLAAKAADAGAKAAAAGAAAQTLAQTQAQLAAQPATAPVAAAMAPQVQQAAQEAQAAATAAQQAKAALDAVPTPSMQVTDVVPLAAKDARGTGLVAATLPLALGGVVGGAVISLTLTGRGRRLGALAAYSLLAGLGMALVLHSWFGFLPGSFFEAFLIVTTAVAATAGLVVGLHSLLGPLGIGIAAVITVLIANPISGAQMPPEWLPGAWGAIGQWFVPGAAATLMRLSSYFPDASQARGWTAMLLWLAAGVAMLLLGRRGDAKPAPADEVVPADEPTVDDRNVELDAQVS